LCYKVKPCGNVLALNGRNNVGKENKTKIKTSFFYIYNVYLKSKTKSKKKKRKTKSFPLFLTTIYREYGALASVAGSYYYK
jgi:hypothetical protein